MPTLNFKDIYCIKCKRVFYRPNGSWSPESDSSAPGCSLLREVRSGDGRRPEAEPKSGRRGGKPLLLPSFPVCHSKGLPACEKPATGTHCALWAKGGFDLSNRAVDPMLQGPTALSRGLHVSLPTQFDSLRNKTPPDPAVKRIYALSRRYYHSAYATTRGPTMRDSSPQPFPSLIVEWMISGLPPALNRASCVTRPPVTFGVPWNWI